ncbi:MAG: LptF/LptG family permease [Ignavibacterium album]|nr:LptF/LptG family permease [Ignavibacterium album]
MLVTFLYLVFMKISQAFGKNGSLDPVLTAWFANIIFLAAAVYNLFRSRL